MWLVVGFVADRAVETDRLLTHAVQNCYNRPDFDYDGRDDLPTSVEKYGLT